MVEDLLKAIQIRPTKINPNAVEEALGHDHLADSLAKADGFKKHATPKTPERTSNKHTWEIIKSVTLERGRYGSLKLAQHDPKINSKLEKTFYEGYNIRLPNSERVWSVAQTGETITSQSGEASEPQWDSQVVDERAGAERGGRSHSKNQGRRCDEERKVAHLNVYEGTGHPLEWERTAQDHILGDWDLLSESESDDWA